MASHDDDTNEKVARSARRGVAIAEFPATVALAVQSQDYGAVAMMGAPNLVRGGSHVGAMGVKEAVQAEWFASALTTITPPYSTRRFCWKTWD